MNDPKMRLVSMLSILLLALIFPMAALAQDETPNEEQRHTRAHHESWGPGLGLTLVGTVVDWDEDALQVRTTTGVENVILTQQTKMATELEKGQRVAVDYNRSTQGAIIADQVRFGDVKGIDKVEPNATQEQMRSQAGTGDDVLMGNVVALEKDRIMLLTPVGERMVLITPATVTTVAYTLGDPVAVDYRMENDRMVGSRVRSLTKEEMSSMHKMHMHKGEDHSHMHRGDHRDGAMNDGSPLVGELRYWNYRQMRIETDKGIETVLVNPQTRYEAQLQKGATVAVEFTRNDKGIPVATLVREPAAARAGMNR